MLLCYLTLAVCTIGFAAMVYRYDLYDREPLPAIVLVMILGGAGMIAAGRVQVELLAALGATAAGNWNVSMAVAAGVTEELAKFLAAGAILLLSRKWFNDPLDGVIYGSFAGLGAAIEESIAILAFDAPLEFLPASEPVRLAGHTVMGGISAAGLGALVRVRRSGDDVPGGPGVVSRALPLWMLPVCLAAGIALHAVWDLVAFSAADAGRMLPWHTAASLGLMLGGFVAYRWLVAVGARRSRGVFAGE